MKPKHCIILITLLSFLHACEERVHNNPFDPEYEATLWAPKNLTIEQISGDEIKLTWQQHEKHIEGFKIDRKEGSDNWEPGFATINKSDSNYIDNEVIQDEDYIYRLYAYAGTNNSSFIEKGIYFSGCGYTITDYDGNEYNTVQIGNQCWMKENLKATHYSNGDTLVDGTGAGDISGDYTTKYYFTYGDNESNVATYGRLYTWAAIMNGVSSSNSNPSGVQGVCPDGWHVPSESEWNELTSYLGESAKDKLLETGTTHWDDSNTSATNSSGFTALPAGYRYKDGSFDHKGNEAYFWTSSESNSTNAKYQFINTTALEIYSHRDKSSGFSLRCIKN